MGWIGGRLAIVAALTLLMAQIVGPVGLVEKGRAEPTSQTPLVEVRRLGTVNGARKTLSETEFRESSVQGLYSTGTELAPASGSSGTLTTGRVSSPIPFSHLGLSWHGVLSNLDGVLIEVRASRDGAAWTDWQHLHINDDLPFEANGQASSTLMSFDISQGLYAYAQARLTLLDTGQLVRPSISSLSFAFIDPTPGPTTAEASGSAATPLGSVQPLDVTTSAGPWRIWLPLVQKDKPPDPGIGKPAVISRSGWGCPDGQYSPNWWAGSEPDYRTVTAIIIHHTATSNWATDWAREVRAIWTYHTYYVDNGDGTFGWGDIGYNYLIDPNGVIYEGRAGGDDVVGAHAGKYNWGSMGVAFIGTHTYYAPSKAAQNSMINLLSWKAYQRGIDPMVMSRYFVDKYLPTIMGHRDAISTECPGSAAYSLMNYFRTAVRDRLATQ